MSNDLTITVRQCSAYLRRPTRCPACGCNEVDEVPLHDGEHNTQLYRAECTECRRGWICEYMLSGVFPET